MFIRKYKLEYGNLLFAGFYVRLLVCIFILLSFPNRVVQGHSLLAGVGIIDENGERHGGYIDTLGNVVIPFDFEVALDFNDGRAQVMQNGKRGFIDGKGNIVIPCLYNEVSSFNHDIARVKKNGKYGFIDRHGYEVLPCVYSDIGSIREGIVLVQYQGLKCYIEPDFNGHARLIYKETGEFDVLEEGDGYVKKSLFDSMKQPDGDFHEGMASIRERTLGDWNNLFLYGFIDNEGNEIIPCVYSFVSDFDKGIAVVEKEGKWGAIDKKGNVIIPIKHDGLIGPVGNVYFAKNEGKWKLFDFDNRLMTSLCYDDVQNFSDGGLAAVKLSGKWGFVDSMEIERIPFVYDDVCQGFNSGFAIVKKGGVGVINKLGECVVPFKYDKIVVGVYEGTSEKHYFKVGRGGKYGVINENGKTILPCRYDEIEDFMNGFAVVRKNGEKGIFDAKYGFINERGEEIIPCIYETATSFGDPW